MNPRGRPQIEQRRLILVENFGFLFAALINALRAIWLFSFSLSLEWETKAEQQRLGLLRVLSRGYDGYL